MAFITILQYLNTAILPLVAVLLFSYILLRKSKSSKKSPPQPGGSWPLVGHLPLLTGTELPHVTLAKVADKYGPMFQIRVGVYKHIVVSSWDISKEIFTTHDAIVSSRPLTIGPKLMGYNYANFGFTPYGDYWRQMRKVTASELLSNRRIEQLKHVRAFEVAESVKGLFKQWLREKNKENLVRVDMKKWFGDINLNGILRMVAGKRYHGEVAAEEEREARRYQKVMRKFFHLMGLFVLRDALPFLGWLDFGGHEKSMKENAKEFDSIVSGWLEEHRRRMKLGESDDKAQDFMDVLLHVLHGVDLPGFDPDTVTKATSMTLIASGSDTVTITLIWALSLLLNNPTNLRKVQEELDSQVGKDKLLDESDVDKLVYLQAVIKEALRLYPPAPLVTRELAEDCEVGGYQFSKGDRFILNIYKVHRDPSVWPKPEEFNPERFLTTHKDIDIKGQHFELTPFGVGRRACPGINLGVKMTQFLLASFLQAYEVVTPSNAPVDMSGSAGLTFGKATPLEVLAKPRLPAQLYE